MDVRRALIGAFVATLACGPRAEEFKFSGEIEFSVLYHLIDDNRSKGVDEDNWPTMIGCEAICAEQYSRDLNSGSGTRRWVDGEVESCELTLPADRRSPYDGYVECSGHASIQHYCIGEGRRPLGHVETAGPNQGTGLGRMLAAMAHLEAASVDAFEQLAEQLTSWGAPPQIVQRCRSAAADERRHARWLTDLSEREGAMVPAPRRERVAPELFDVALHNAVEGCVHETFSALLAMHRAQRAGRRDLRRLFARIAADETRHAQLAWDVHDWLCAQLPADRVDAIGAARRRALAELPEQARALASQPGELGAIGLHEAQRWAGALAERLAA